jgi:hypothetical protein
MKKPSLFQMPSPTNQAVENSSPVGEEFNEPRAISRRPPSREGKRVLSVYLPPEAWKQLRMLAVNMETSTQDLGEQAINMLFEKHRLNRIA